MFSILSLSYPIVSLFCLIAAIPVNEALANPNVALLITAHGGHIGFLEGPFPNHQRYMNRIFSQFMGAVLGHREELRVATADEPVS